MERLDISIRQQLLKDDVQHIGMPFALVGDNARAVQANTRHMALMLQDSAVKDRASRMAAFAEALIDVNLHHHVKEPVACARGCSHCCTTYVSTSLPEVFRLARAVGGKTAAAARIGVAAAKAKTMPQLQREVTRVVCPILEDGACSEYAVRPLVCRAVLSTSLERCINIFTRGSAEAFAAPPSIGALRSYMVVMVRAALVLAGLPFENFELTHALAIAIHT